MILRLTLSTVLISSIVSPLVAQQPAPAPQPSPSAAAPAKPAKQTQQSPPDGKLYATGTLKAIDAEAETVTFTDASGKDVTWAVDERIAQNARAAAERRMTILKPGAAVRVIYRLDASGVPKVIDIGRKRERRPGEAEGAATGPAPQAPPR